MEGGIDEAGRGPVLGPLVVAGVAGDRDRLHALGCRDSKALSARNRERLARLLHDDSEVHVEVRIIDPSTLDAERETASLNDIELARFQDIARHLAQRGARTIVADAADVDAARFGRRIQEALLPHDGASASAAVEARHRADADHACVAAASIVAKVERDRHIATLARRLERQLEMPLGSGYPSDPKTKAFLRNWVERFGTLPEGTRHSWRTAKDLLAPKQTALDGFETA